MAGGDLQRTYPKRTVLIAIFAAAIISGLLISKFGWDIYLGWLALVLVLVAVLVRSQTVILCLVVAFSGLVLGTWRGGVVLSDYQRLTDIYGQTVTFSGRVADDTSFTDTRQTEFHLDKLKMVSNKNAEPTRGRLRVRGFPPNKLSRGDFVSVSGRLGPSFGNRQGQIYFANIQILRVADDWLTNVRKKFFAGVYTALPEPQSSLGLGFLVGLRALLPDTLTDRLSATGLTHIVAVSGFNLTILVRFTRRLFAKHSKYLATASSLGLITVFLAVTGLAPSVFRASLVALLAIGAWYYGRSIKPSVLILLPAAATAFVNPSYIWGDIGWYLSFLAFFGVLVLAPLLGALLMKKRQSTLMQILIETISAQILAVPLIVYIFSQLSIIAPLANVIVLPLIPVAMILTLIAGLGGIWLPALVGWIAWPANMVLKFMIDIATYLGDLNFASVRLSLTFLQMLAVYLVVALIVMVLRRRIGHRLDPKYSIIR